MVTDMVFHFLKIVGDKKEIIWERVPQLKGARKETVRTEIESSYSNKKTMKPNT